MPAWRPAHPADGLVGYAQTFQRVANKGTIAELVAQKRVGSHPALRFDHLTVPRNAFGKLLHPVGGLATLH
jgi:hypothetical protein